MKYTKNDTTITQEIVEYLLGLIKSKKIPPNKIMPSEHALMNHFNCSRGVVVSAYNKLAALGATYSINKRGHFVAENFHNLIKPLSFLLKCDKQQGIKINNLATDPDWFEKKNIIFISGYTTYEKEYFKEKRKIAQSTIYVTNKLFQVIEKLDLSKSIVDELVKNKMLNNIIYSLEYEDVNYFGVTKLVVITFHGYDADSISIAGKMYINPDDFRFFHQEFASIHKIG
ncbi:winged helix-turn-helix domain-containing protein [Mycoplasmopsis cricetuli]|uniref:winged helix-turn-helix domain-containing protein n=1 Tax=Mycoplasmopsis cricetuli TaxID=171283 RepID=UPI000471E80B|nr:GntR family transcriptional regulator [Mycoplasmopsis cricetuli]